jgi:hypothetical protein
MGNAMHAMDTIDSMLGNAPDTINPTLGDGLDTISPMSGNDLPGMSFIRNGTGDMSSAGDKSAAKTPSGDFTVHLNGTVQPVSKGPDFGPNINLSDGTWSSINIYPVAGIGNNPNHPIGTLYVQLTAMDNSICVYNIPGRGTMEMQFTNFTLTQTSDNHGGFYDTGTEDLNIVAATGAFAGYVGGHNHMVDQLHIMGNGTVTDSCFCNITPPT